MQAHIVRACKCTLWHVCLNLTVHIEVVEDEWQVKIFGESGVFVDVDVVKENHGLIDWSQLVKRPLAHELRGRYDTVAWNTTLTLYGSYIASGLR